MKPIDLTSLYTDPFVYQVRNGEATVEIAVDFDQIIVELQNRIPTALGMTDILDDKGDPMNGLQVVFECFKKGEPVPAYLPTLNHVSDAIAKAFRLPEDPGNTLRVRMALFGAWLSDAVRRGELKKSTSASPLSPGLTPALSASST